MNETKVAITKNGYDILRIEEELNEQYIRFGKENQKFDRKRAKKSNGIGLSITKQLIELNGGKITANYKNGILSVAIEL